MARAGARDKPFFNESLRNQLLLLPTTPTGQKKTPAPFPGRGPKSVFGI
jgi:hypothetical protein